MKEDLIFDALNEIDDRYIEETVCYKPKAKAFTLKKAVALAACLAVVAFSAYAVKDYGTFPKNNPPTTTTPTELASQPNNTCAAITQETEIASASSPTGLGGEITVGCLTKPSWEDENLSGKFTIVNIKDKEYIVNGNTVNYDDLESVIAQTTLKAKNQEDGKELSTSAICYKIKGISENAFVALKFEQEDSFYIYERSGYMPKTVEELISDLSLEENLTLNEGQIYHEKSDEETSSVEISKATEEFKAEFLNILKRNKNAQSKDSSYDRGSRRITFYFYLKGKEIGTHVFFNSNGLLTLSVANSSFSFELPKDEFSNLSKKLQNYESDKKDVKTSDNDNSPKVTLAVTVAPYNPFE